MAAHDKLLLEEQEEYECVAMQLRTHRADDVLTRASAMNRFHLTSRWRPTWLPAPSLALQYVRRTLERGIDADIAVGTHGDVPHRSAQGAFGLPDYEAKDGQLISPIQTRMQVVSPTPGAIYSGIGNAISTISRAEGYMSLWRGVSSVVVGAGATPRTLRNHAKQTLTTVQVLRTLSTLRRTKWSSKRWVAMPWATIRSQLVRAKKQNTE